MARFGVIGSDGRMGRALVEAIAHGGDELAGGVDKDGDVAGLAKESDVMVDFSSPDALEFNLEGATTGLTPIVIGTTGLGDRHHWLIDQAAERIAVLQTGNTSLGVTLLAHLVREAASRLGEDWDIEIVEAHHRRKVDAPSGTALLLGEAAAAARGRHLDSDSERGRDGLTGPRRAGAIGFASVRGGTVAGEHSVFLLGEEERLVLSHSAESRAIFARGAVRAGRWLLGQAPGRYTMPEVLGLA